MPLRSGQQKSLFSGAIEGVRSRLFTPFLWSICGPFLGWTRASRAAKKGTVFSILVNATIIGGIILHRRCYIDVLGNLD